MILNVGLLSNLDGCFLATSYTYLGCLSKDVVIIRLLSLNASQVEALLLKNDISETLSFKLLSVIRN